MHSRVCMVLRITRDQGHAPADFLVTKAVKKWQTVVAVVLRHRGGGWAILPTHQVSLECCFFWFLSDLLSEGHGAGTVIRFVGGP